MLDEKVLLEFPVTRLISIISRKNYAWINKKLKPLNIGPGQFLYLMCLSHNPEISQECLSGKLNINKSCCARALKALQEHGYIKKKRCNKDKRKFLVDLTEKGREVIPFIKKILDERNEAMIENMNGDVANALKKGLIGMIMNIKDEFGGNHHEK